MNKLYILLILILIVPFVVIYTLAPDVEMFKMQFAPENYEKIGEIPFSNEKPFTLSHVSENLPFNLSIEEGKTKSFELWANKTISKSIRTYLKNHLSMETYPDNSGNGSMEILVDKPFALLQGQDFLPARIMKPYKELFDETSMIKLILPEQVSFEPKAVKVK